MSKGKEERTVGNKKERRNDRKVRKEEGNEERKEY